MTQRRLPGRVISHDTTKYVNNVHRRRQDITLRLKVTKTYRVTTRVVRCSYRRALRIISRLGWYQKGGKRKTRPQWRSYHNDKANYNRRRRVLFITEIKIDTTIEQV